MFRPAWEVLLPAVAILCREMQTCQALLTSTQHVVQHTDRCMGMTCFGNRPGQTYCLARSRTRVPPALLVICVPGQRPGRLLCRDGCWGASPWEPHPSHGHSSLLHRSRARPEPVAMPKPLWRHLYRQAKVELCFLCRDPRKLASQWPDCCFTVPLRIWVGSPGFPWESLNSGSWRSWAHRLTLCPPPIKKKPNIPLKLIFQGPCKEADKEIWISRIVLFGGFPLALRNCVWGRLRTLASLLRSNLSFRFLIK